MALKSVASMNSSDGSRLVSLHLQLANLAKLHLDLAPRSRGAFDYELCFRFAAGKLRIRQLQIVRKAVERQDRKLRADESDSDSDSESGSVDDTIPLPSENGDFPSPEAEPAAAPASVFEVNPVLDSATPLSEVFTNITPAVPT